MQLATIMHERYKILEERTLSIIIELDEENAFQISEEPITSQFTKKVPFHEKIAWVWITLAIAISATITVFTIPEGVYPIGYLRVGLGSLFVFFLPGFVLVRVLFLTKMETVALRSKMDSLDYAALSLGISIAVVAVIGLMLNYTPWGLSLTSMTLSLLLLTSILAIAAMIREHQLNS